jgi:hypothetical protein
MFWSLRENLCGINHMRRLAGRLILRRSRFHYVDNLKARGFAVEPVLDDRGDPLNCRLCGFVNLRFALSPGFEMTSCSTLGLKVLKHKDQLNLWSMELPHNSKEAMQKAGALTAAADDPGPPGPNPLPDGQAEVVVKGSPGAESVV